MPLHAYHASTCTIVLPQIQLPLLLHPNSMHLLMQVSKLLMLMHMLVALPLMVLAAREQLPLFR